MARLVTRLVVPYTGSSSPLAPARVSSSKRSELESLPSSSSSSSPRLRTSSSTLRRTTDTSASEQNLTHLRSTVPASVVTDVHDGRGSSGNTCDGGTPVEVLGFLGRRPEVNRVFRTQ